MGCSPPDKAGEESAAAFALCKRDDHGIGHGAALERVCHLGWPHQKWWEAVRMLLDTADPVHTEQHVQLEVAAAPTAP